MHQKQISLIKQLRRIGEQLFKLRGPRRNNRDPAIGFLDRLGAFRRAIDIDERQSGNPLKLQTGLVTLADSCRLIHFDLHLHSGRILGVDFDRFNGADLDAVVTNIATDGEPRHRAFKIDVVECPLALDLDPGQPDHERQQGKHRDQHEAADQNMAGPGFHG